MRRRPHLEGWLMLAALLVFPTAAGAGDPAATEEIRQRRDRLLQSPPYQTELPGWDTRGAGSGGGPGEGGGRGAPGDPRADSGPRADSDPGAAGDASEGEGWPVEQRVRKRRGEAARWQIPALGDTAAGILRALLWGAVGVAVVLLAVGVLRELAARRWRRAEAGVPSAPPETGEARAPAPEESEIEALARRGDYGEAAHLLLLDALEALARRLRAEFAPSRTSREILAERRLGEAARRALGELVAAVERSLFGGQPLGAGDWERCRAAYVTLTGAPGAPGARGAPGDRS